MPDHPLPDPLFRDPRFDGAADPMILWDRRRAAWRLLYTQLRATLPEPGWTWCHGTNLGQAESRDGGRTWLPLDPVAGLAAAGIRDTWWAPEVVWDGGLYHLFVARAPGIPDRWDAPKQTLHFVSPDLQAWTGRGALALSSERCLDGCLHRLDDGGWRLWYKDEAAGGQTWSARSPDLERWVVEGPVITGRPHEGADVFRLGGWWWMLTDPGGGLEVWRSPDGLAWTAQGMILAEAGRPPGRHAEVVVAGGRAVLVYRTHPVMGAWPSEPGAFIPLPLRRTALHAAELTVVGDRLALDRDAPVAPLPDGP